MISIICPFYNEESMVVNFFKEVITILKQLEEEFEMICINDGSTDATLTKLIDAKKQYQQLRIIDFSRNFGKEAAVTAGIDCARGDAIIPIDADLQDPPELIIDLVKMWKSGYDVVLAKRNDRCSDSFFKRITANLFYKLHNKISNIKIPEHVGDYRLMSRKVVNHVKLLTEKQRFMKGLFAWVGFKTITIDYKRKARLSGSSKFNFWKLWNFALDGITSFSTMPLRIWLYIGTIISLISFTYGTFILLKTLFFGSDVPGFPSLFVSILFLGGIQLISLGILGEYIGRLYTEVKSRPIYVIEKEY